MTAIINDVKKINNFMALNSIGYEKYISIYPFFLRLSLTINRTEYPENVRK